MIKRINKLVAFLCLPLLWSCSLPHIDKNSVSENASGILGEYHSEIYSGGYTTRAITEFYYDSDNRLIGQYKMFESRDTVPGTLSDCTQVNKYALDCKWKDKYGTGTLKLEFANNYSEFRGLWNTEGETDAHPWNGIRSNLLKNNIKPIEGLLGPWKLTVFVLEDKKLVVRKCLPYDGIDNEFIYIVDNIGELSFYFECENGSKYEFSFRGDEISNNYFLSVANDKSISIDNFQVRHTNGEGWEGTNTQTIKGENVPVSAAISKIEGRRWYGWAIVVVQRKEEGIEDETFFRVDLTRRKNWTPQ